MRTVFSPLFILLFISEPSYSCEFTWDDRALGNGLHVYAHGEDSQHTPWLVREIKEEDLSFYQNLFGNPNVMQSMGNGNIVLPEEVYTRSQRATSLFSEGIPFARMTFEQKGQPVGFLSVIESQKHHLPGVVEFARGFDPSVQGKGLGTAALNFLIKEWAPKVRRISLGLDSNAPAVATQKFKCSNEPLRYIYATARPSNAASWQCYKHFSFQPVEPTDIDHTISYENWELSQEGPLEEYIIQKHFSDASIDLLQKNTLYAMIDEKSTLRTLSFVESYNSLRYHFMLDLI